MGASIDDVARLANVSTSTVSYVLNNGPRKVGPKLTARVWAAVRELDYRPSRIARSMVTGRSGVLGVIHTPYTYEANGSSYVNKVMNGIALGAQQHRYDVLLYTNALTDQVETALSDLLDGRSDGLVAIAPGRHHEIISQLTARKVPLVSISGYGHKGVPFHICDNEHGVEQAVRHLAELGHRKIGTLYGDLSSHDGRERYKAFNQITERLHLQGENAWKAGGQFSSDRTQDWVRKMLSLADRPTAIFAANDDMAVAAMETAQAMGLRVPEDLSVVGFDDTLLARLCNPPLTTVNQPLESMGTSAVRNLLHLLKGESVPTLMRFPTTLVVRGSTAPVRIS